jgi:hypothetical protein
VLTSDEKHKNADERLNNNETIIIEGTYTIVRRRPMYWLADPAIAPPLYDPQNSKCMQNRLTTHATAPC